MKGWQPCDGALTAPGNEDGAKLKWVPAANLRDVDLELSWQTRF